MLVNINKILETLPHRYPFILVDRVINIDPGKSLTAIKNVTINEPFFQGHFPGNPVMPGVLILEALAQASAIFALSSGAEIANNSVQVFAGIDNAKFKKIVVPGDQLLLQIEYLRHKQSIWKILGKAYVGDELACSAELTSAIKDFS